MNQPDTIAVSLFSHRVAAICDEMGATLKYCALSPNIKDREDYSCAMFDPEGKLIAQAAHIPIHLGSMTWCMRDVVTQFDWSDGDYVVFNDPFLGGTHLPDITVVAPIFSGVQLLGFSASRAHHADVGGKSPGSMGLEQCLADEGVVIHPVYWFKSGQLQPEGLAEFFQKARNQAERNGDLEAQRAACHVGQIRLLALHQQMPVDTYFQALFSISEKYGRSCIQAIPDGRYVFKDQLEDDGLGHGPFDIRVTLHVMNDVVDVDFSGTSSACLGPLNCPLSVTAAAVFYVFRCLMPEHTPQTAAIFSPIRLSVPEHSLLNAPKGCAVAAGNVETSQRIVDVVLGALAQAIPDRIPAASQGTMNNVLFGCDDWVYYETLAGGAGAHAQDDGLSACHSHMTNTKNTSIEVLEMHYPLRILRYEIRRGSGGKGQFKGGDGLVRTWLLLEDCHLSLLSERRKHTPYGLSQGGEGKVGKNQFTRKGKVYVLAAKFSEPLQAGDHVCIETPGGGGFGLSVSPDII